MALLLSFLPVWGYDFEYEGLAYNILSTADLTVRWVDVVDDSMTEVVIPEQVEYRGRKLTVTELNHVAIPPRITKISVPETVESIPMSCFSPMYPYHETGLTEVILPSGITEIPAYCFSGCSKLKVVRFRNATLDYENTDFEDGSEDLIWTIVPETITSIGEYAFAWSGIEAISVPGVASLNGTFENCENLKKVILNEGTENLVRTFYDCVALTDVKIPSTLKKIGYGTFVGTSIVELDTNNVEEISVEGIKGDSFETLIFGSDLKEFPKPINKRVEYDEYWYYLGCTVSNFWNVSMTLPNLKSVWIKDGENPFCLQGMEKFYRYDAYNQGWLLLSTFAYNNLEYYYIGRPVVTEWTYSNGSKQSNGAYWWMKANKSGYVEQGSIQTLEIGGYCTAVPKISQPLYKLKLGPNVTTFDFRNINSSSLELITSASMVPPIVENGNYFPTSVYTDVVVEIPVGTKSLYQNAEGWKNFWNFVEKDLASNEKITEEVLQISAEGGVGEIRAINKPERMNVSVFNLYGVMIERTRDSIISGVAPGIYIVKIGNNVSKVQVK